MRPGRRFAGFYVVLYAERYVGVMLRDDFTIFFKAFF
jgi:hypothetical protein